MAYRQGKTIPSGEPAPNRRISRLRFDQGKVERLTHYLFRYPAKFHPPAVRELIERYSDPGDSILDPFCGSGTSLVEAAALERNSIGSDVDPLAVFVSRIKTRRLRPASLRSSADRLLDRMKRLERSASEYQDRQFRDLSKRTFDEARARHQLRVPPIPNFDHWFRRYVSVDLARLKKLIVRMEFPTTHRDFFLLCFASIVRASSNADPVPVSGLEVTSHMLRKVAEGRTINPFSLYRRALLRALDDMEQFVERTTPSIKTSAVWSDATQLSRRIRNPVDLVVTSPPYHNAVDYYRRHTLEMYWLGLVADHADRLELLPRYIGRSRVSQKHPFVAESETPSQLAKRWERKIRRENSERADAFKHYMVSMRRCAEEIAVLLPRGKRAVFVLGRSSWNGHQIPTTQLFEELCHGLFRLDDSLWYPLKNRYMSYSRQNGANIDREYVLVLKRC